MYWNEGFGMMYYLLYDNEVRCINTTVEWSVLYYYFTR